MTNPSPDLSQPQAETESVANDDRLKSLAEWWAGKCHSAYADVRAKSPQAWDKLAAHIDSIITARVAAERERISTMNFSVGSIGVQNDDFMEGVAVGVGKYRMAIRSLAASQSAPAKTEGPKSACTDAEVLREFARRYDEYAADRTAQIFGITYTDWAAKKYPAAPSTPAKEPAP